MINLTKLIIGISLLITFSGCEDGDTIGEPISAIEAYNLEYVYNKQKMNKDIYLDYYEQTNLEIYHSIAENEKHNGMKSIEKILVENNQFSNYLKNLFFGEFTSYEIQEEFYEYYFNGSGSLVVTLDNACKIEKENITMLKTLIEENINYDVEVIYNKILWDSEDNYEAFDNRLIDLGITDGCCNIRAYSGVNNNIVECIVE